MQPTRLKLSIHGADADASTRAAGDQRSVDSAAFAAGTTVLEIVCFAGHPYHLYTYDPIDNVPDGVALQDAGQILPQSLIFRNQNGQGKGSMAAFSDLFRYKLLLDRGGWWVDTDVFCLKPFDFAAPYVFGAEDKPVASGVIKMPRGRRWPNAASRWPARCTLRRLSGTN